jgi:hypothetical protein
MGQTQKDERGHQSGEVVVEILNFGSNLINLTLKSEQRVKGINTPLLPFHLSDDSLGNLV